MSSDQIVPDDVVGSGGIPPECQGAWMLRTVAELTMCNDGRSYSSSP